MKNLFLTLVFILASTFASANTNLFQVLENSYPEIYCNLEQVTTINESVYENTYFSEKQVFKVKNQNMYFIINQNKGYIIEHKDSSLTVKDIENSNKFLTFYKERDGSFDFQKTELTDIINNTTVLVCSFWETGTCVISAAAIAASDGPVPVMDALAAAYLATCLAACA